MKRKHTTTKIHDKLKAIELVKNGMRVRDVSASYGVGKQTVLDWMQQEERLKNYVNHNAKNYDAMSIRPGLTPQTSEALFIWFEQMRERGMYAFLLTNQRALVKSMLPILQEYQFPVLFFKQKHSNSMKFSRMVRPTFPQVLAGLLDGRRSMK